ncbi:MAG: iron-containing alcohol dehydrogenase [Clostridiaceae bacterium]|nr:iron-containing alcohol dehydrogenase [Clostridiaceae bacterium]
MSESFFMPVHVIMGENCVLENKDRFKLGKKALIVSGPSSAKKSGALDDVIKVLSDINIPYDIFDKVENNPTIENVYEGGQFAKKVGADFIIGIGGGSPLDAAKAVAVYATNDIEPMKIFDGVYESDPLPMILIPTTAGTGSEVTQYSILTLNSIQNKRSFTSEKVFAKYAFLDGRYTMSLSLSVTINTMLDAMSHCIESILNKNSNTTSEMIALDGLRRIARSIKYVKEGNIPLPVRQNLLVASTLGGIAIAQTGTTIPHSMGYQLTYFKDVPHGKANALFMGEFLSFVEKSMPKKVALIYQALGLSGNSEFRSLIYSLIEKDVKITTEEILKYASVSINAKNVQNCPVKVTEEDEVMIYKNSLL